MSNPIPSTLSSLLLARNCWTVIVSLEPHQYGPFHRNKCGFYNNIRFTNDLIYICTFAIFPVKYKGINPPTQSISPWKRLFPIIPFIIVLRKGPPSAIPGILVPAEQARGVFIFIRLLDTRYHNRSKPSSAEWGSWVELSRKPGISES